MYSLKSKQGDKKIKKNNVENITIGNMKNKNNNKQGKYVLPEMKYDENGEALFNSSKQSEINIKNPNKSFLARHEKWVTNN